MFDLTADYYAFEDVNHRGLRSLLRHLFRGTSERPSEKRETEY